MSLFTDLELVGARARAVREAQDKPADEILGDGQAIGSLPDFFHDAFVDTHDPLLKLDYAQAEAVANYLVKHYVVIRRKDLP